MSAAEIVRVFYEFQAIVNYNYISFVVIDHGKAYCEGLFTLNYPIFSSMLVYRKSPVHVTHFSYLDSTLPHF